MGILDWTSFNVREEARERRKGYWLLSKWGLTTKNLWSILTMMRERQLLCSNLKTEIITDLGIFLSSKEIDT